MAAPESITSPFSQYIDQFLQPFAQSLPSYVRDGVHLLELLKYYTWESTYMWASLDINSLYTSIPHSIGLQAATQFLMEDPTLNPRQAQFVVEATEFCLTHNYLQFDLPFVSTFLDEFTLRLARVCPLSIRVSLYSSFLLPLKHHFTSESPLEIFTTAQLCQHGRGGGRSKAVQRQSSAG